MMPMIALLLAASTGLSTNLARTAAPNSCPNASNTNAIGTSLAFAPADHQHMCVSASATQVGCVDTGAQTWLGVKTLTSGAIISATLSYTDPGNIAAAPSSGIKQQATAKASFPVMVTLPPTSQPWVALPGVESNWAAGCKNGEVAGSFINDGVLPTPTTLGTMTQSPKSASGTLVTTLRANDHTSTATIGSSAAMYGGTTSVYRGDAAGLGGFLFYTRVATTTAVATQRALFGVGANAPANANPSSFTNTIYIGYDSGQTTLQACSNDTVGSATCTDLGSNYPVNSTAVYDIWINAAPNGGAVNYQVERLDASVTAASGSFTDLPSTTTFLAYQNWVNNGTTASAVVLRFTRVCLFSRF